MQPRCSLLLPNLSQLACVEAASSLPCLYNVARKLPPCAHLWPLICTILGLCVAALFCKHLAPPSQQFLCSPQGTCICRTLVHVVCLLCFPFPQDMNVRRLPPSLLYTETRVVSENLQLRCTFPWQG